MGMFDFMADRGGYTYEDVQRRRALVDTLANTGNPTTFGGGISALAGALGAIIGDRRADRAEEQRAAEADSVFEAALNGMPQSNPGLADALTMGGATFSPAAYEPTGDALRDGIVETANAIGADPLDLATAISYETAGTFDPTKQGPTTQWGQHEGLIQFGQPQQQQYGVDLSSREAALSSQLGADGAIAKYFRSSGFKPGMSGLDLYSTINAGAPGRYSASDANNGGAPGSVADKWNNQMGDHRQKAAALLGGSYTPAAPQSAGGISIPAPAPVNVSLIRAMSNPYLSPEQKQILGGIMAQQQAQQITPYQMAQLQMQQQQIAQAGQITPYQQAQLDMQRGQNDWERERFDIEQAAASKPVQTNDIREFEYARESGYPGTFADWQTEKAKAGASSVNVNTASGSKLYDKLDEKNGEMFATLIDSGATAARNLEQVEQLEGVLDRTPTGIGAVARQKLGQWGVRTDGLDDIQAATALINQMVPAQRPPGSGTMSDRDLELFKQSLPSLINTPEGNQKILGYMRGIAEYSVKQASIASAVANREISPEQGRQQLMELENPLAGVTDKTENGSDTDLSDDDLLKKYGG